jgi:hypothetical protein
MRVGMLWFDNNQKRDLDAKLEQAIAYYMTKYGKRPTVCYLHPSMLLNARSGSKKVELRESNMILPHHFWLGMGDEEIEQAAV